MLRTSLRIQLIVVDGGDASVLFLSSNAQDFIEDLQNTGLTSAHNKFLSSNAQDFIEDLQNTGLTSAHNKFLSSNAQDFIEEHTRQFEKDRVRYS